MDDGMNALDDERDDDGDTQAALRTGIRDQWLVVSGWGASHADTGTPGPHLHLSTNDGSNPVIRTSQIPDLIDALHKVGGRIDQMWEKDGETWFTGNEPDPNDPAFRKQKRIEDLELRTRLADQWTEVARILLDAADAHEAAVLLAPMLGVDDVQVLASLTRFSLFTVTRDARANREQFLKDLRGE